MYIHQWHTHISVNICLALLGNNLLVCERRRYNDHGAWCFCDSKSGRCVHMQFTIYHKTYMCRLPSSVNLWRAAAASVLTSKHSSCWCAYWNKTSCFFSVLALAPPLSTQGCRSVPVAKVRLISSATLLAAGVSRCHFSFKSKKPAADVHVSTDVFAGLCVEDFLGCWRIGSAFSSEFSV